MDGARKCEANSMKENLLYWTSENKDIDELIQYIQLNATQSCDYLEWISFEKFEMLNILVRVVIQSDTLTLIR